MSDTLVGKIRKVKYHRVGPGSRSGVPFLIAEIEGGRVVKGEMREPSYSETYRFIGEWRAQKTYGGEAFEFAYFEEVVENSVGGIAQFLTRKIKGLGKVKSEAIVDRFGTDALRVLQKNPASALVVRGVTPEIVDAIHKYFEENKRIDPVAVAKLLDMFSGHYFPKKLAEDVAADFGSDAPSLVRENPYILLAYPRTGWKSVDPFALAQGYAADGLERHKAAIVESFEQHSNEGHTFATKNEIDMVSFRLIGDRAAHEAWVAAINEGLVVSHGLDESDGDDVPAKVDASLRDVTSTFALPRVAQAERDIARNLAAVAASARPLPFEASTDGLNDDQRTAVEMMHDSGVCLLLGAPGTGKTYTIGRFVRSCLDAGMERIRCVAPTGKAAKRTEEMIASATGSANRIPSTTVHRALEPQPGDAPLGVPGDSAKIGRGREGFHFGRHEANPVEADVIIVDETSMLDVKLADSLLRAVAAGTRVIFVGDTNQLPSVGPGSVLRDIRDSGVVPHVELTKIVRSDGGGRVVRACHSIKDGRVPEPADDLSLPLENWVHVEAGDPSEVNETIYQLYKSIHDNGNYDPYWDVQVVSAEKRKEHIGCRPLNDRLSLLLNPKARPPADDKSFRPEFQDGDKVVRTKNGLVDLMTPFDEDVDERVDWRWEGGPYALSEIDVVNGDMGAVEAIVTEGNRSYVVVRFRAPERLCRLPMGDSHLESAFAMTVHKSQGSGFKIVIVPVHCLFHWNPRTETGLFSRELFYTGISRAEVALFTVGQWAAVETVVGRKTVGYRRTLLAGRLRDSFDAKEKAAEETTGTPRPGGGRTPDELEAL